MLKFALLSRNYNHKVYFISLNFSVKDLKVTPPSIFFSFKNNKCESILILCKAKQHPLLSFACSDTKGGRKFQHTPILPAT